jgi:hypothetical protein
MNHKPYVSSLRLALLSSCLTFTAPAWAVDDLSKAPSGGNASLRAAQTFSYDSNPARVVMNADAIYGSTTSPELLLTYKTPLLEAYSSSRVDANFFDDADYNSVDFHQDAYVNKRNQRWAVGARANVDYDTTRTSEVTNYSINLPDVHRTRIAAAPYVTYRASERDALSVSGNVINATYDNSAYADYVVYAVQPTYERQFDAFNKGSLSVRGQRYETTSGAKQQSDSIGPIVGWTTTLSPQMTATVTAGAASIDKSGTNTAGSDGWNYIFSGNLAYKDTQDDFNLSASRALEPFGNGTETLLTTFAVRNEHSISPTLSLNAHGMYQIADYSSDPGVNLDQGITVGGGATYKLTETTHLDANYKFRSEDLTNTNSNVDQHVVMVGVTIHPQWTVK